MHPGLVGWLALAALVGVLIVLDVFVLHRGHRTIPVRRAIVDTAAWTAAGVAFAIPVGVFGGADSTSGYLSAFVLEKTLSLDNVAVFAVILGGLAIPTHRQHRLLTLGVLTSLWLRIAFIAGGLALLHSVHPIVYVFGGILVLTGIRMLVHRKQDDAGPPAPTWIRRLSLATARTPTLAALLAIAVADVVFAVDSVPAAFAVTRDSFVIVAATAFSVLGLRPLYFVLAGALDRFRHLRPALAVVLVAIGVKTMLDGVVEIPTWATLALVVSVLGAGVVASLVSRAQLQATWSRLPGPARRLAIAVVALPFLLAGLAMLVLPGPGLPVLAAGLALLAIEFAWARRLLEAVRRRLRDALARARRQPAQETPFQEET